MKAEARQGKKTRSMSGSKAQTISSWGGQRKIEMNIISSDIFLIVMKGKRHLVHPLVQSGSRKTKQKSGRAGGNHAQIGNKKEKCRKDQDEKERRRVAAWGGYEGQRGRGAPEVGG